MIKGLIAGLVVIAILIAVLAIETWQNRRSGVDGIDDKGRSALLAAGAVITLLLAFALSQAAASSKPGIKVGVAMDDKVLTVEMSWPTIRETSEVGIAEYILKHMREARQASH